MIENSPVDNKNIWLVGASTGIGRALALELAPRVKNLFISARSVDGLNKLKEEARNLGNNNIAVFPFDVCNHEAVAEILTKIRSEYSSLDMLIYNAGVYQPSDVLNFNLEEYIHQMEVNFGGALGLIKVVLPYMLSKEMENDSRGHIVGVSSVAAYRALPNAAAYGASKAALTYFLESMRMHVASKGVSVTLVSPGFVKTRLTDKNDFEMPFLMSPEAAAKCITRGLDDGKSEIHFPKKFSIILKLLGFLPEPWYRALMIRFVLKNQG